jgi:hypothetical protein
VDKCKKKNQRLEKRDEVFENEKSHPPPRISLTFFELCNIIAKRLIGGSYYDKKNFSAQQLQEE